jgi:hypothetical protein
MSISGPGVEGANRAPENASSGDPAGRGPEAVSGEPPLLDTAVLEDLEEQLGSQEIASNFARDYARLWVQRQGNLVAAVEREDHERSLDAVISLKVSSAMVGGVRMALLAETVEAFIRGGDFPGGRALAMLAHHGGATVNELQVSYITKGR